MAEAKLLTTSEILAHILLEEKLKRLPQEVHSAFRKRVLASEGLAKLTPEEEAIIEKYPEYASWADKEIELKYPPSKSENSGIPFKKVIEMDDYIERKDGKPIKGIPFFMHDVEAIAEAQKEKEGHKKSLKNLADLREE